MLNSDIVRIQVTGWSFAYKEEISHCWNLEKLKIHDWMFHNLNSKIQQILPNVYDDASLWENIRYVVYSVYYTLHFGHFI